MKEKIINKESEVDICNHVCSSNCRREGCNCLCGEYHCLVCNGEGIVTKTEWTGDDQSYDIEVKCECNED